MDNDDLNVEVANAKTEVDENITDVKLVDDDELDVEVAYVKITKTDVDEDLSDIKVVDNNANIFTHN